MNYYKVTFSTVPVLSRFANPAAQTNVHYIESETSLDVLKLKGWHINHYPKGRKITEVQISKISADEYEATKAHHRINTTDL